MQPTFDWLAANPYSLLFAVVLAALLLARARIAGLGLDMVASAFLVGAATAAIASIAGVKVGIDGATKSIACWIFMYGLGLRIGPSLASCLRGDGAKFTALALVSSVLGLAGAVVFARMWDLPPGSAGGILAGAMTTPAAIGAAEEALHQGVHHLPDNHLFEEASGMISLSFGLSYLWGAIGIFVVCRYLPLALGIDLRAEVRRHEEQGGSQAVEDSGLAGFRPLAIRAYRVANEGLTGCTVHEFLARYPGLKLLNVLRILPSRRDSLARMPTEHGAPILAAAGQHGTTRLHDPDTTLGNYGREPRSAQTLYAKLGAADDVRLRQGDVLTLGGAPDTMAGCGSLIGPEVRDAAALNVPIDQAEIVVTNKALEGRCLEDLRTADFAGEVALHHIERGGVPLPLGLRTRLQRRDVLFVAGVKGAVDRFAAYAGRIAHPSASAELLTLSAGMILGLLLGSMSLRVGDARLGLGNAGGLLVSGVIVSWLMSRPRFAANTPGTARGVLEDFALATFIAIVGLDAGAYLVTGFPGELAAKMLVAGFFVSMLPPVIAWAIGHHVLGINPAVLVGAVAGARTHAGPVQEAAGRTASCVPWIGYPVAHAVSTLLLTAFGYAAMALT
jgi:putative transport protein